MIRQWENVKTIYAARTNSTETIVKRAEESKEQQRTVLEETGVQVAPPSLDQLDRLIDGKTTTDELKTELGLETPPEEAPPEEAPPEETPPEEAPPEKTPDAAQQSEPLSEEQRQERAKTKVDACVKELYSYEVELMSSLGALKQAAIDEYRALPEEQQTQESKVRIGYRYLNMCYDMEVEADRQVKDILNRLRSDLKELGMDTGVADTLWKHYCDEKTTTKEYYLSKYL